MQNVKTPDQVVVWEKIRISLTFVKRGSFYPLHERFFFILNGNSGFEPPAEEQAARQTECEKYSFVHAPASGAGPGATKN
jgi:hypothetical protein